MEKYKQPFNISNSMLEYIAEIMEKIGKLDNFNNLNNLPILRKNNRINSIHSSLAIENNKLSLSQVKDVINGHTVIGPQKEIQEVKNAYKAYELIDNIDPFSINNLKEIHGIMTYLTIQDSGSFRNNAEGVFDGDKCIFIAPPQSMVTTLITELFIWIKETKDIHPLILSSIFHYEFLFIHPFTDGNGRMARLWQNVLLSKWKTIFKYIPIESYIKKYQDEYYKVIAMSHVDGNSNKFIEFMLKTINFSLDEVILNASTSINHINEYVTKMLNVMEYNTPMTAYEIMDKLNLKSKETFRKHYINPAIKANLIALTLMDTPTSKNQRYYKV
ncbi:MAG: Fic family protein [Clostridia bacterium]